jgi:hypothetical protein
MIARRCAAVKVREMLPSKSSIRAAWPLITVPNPSVHRQRLAAG